MVDWAEPGWSVVANFGVICVLGVFDKFFASSRARWFSIHAFANLLVVLTGLPAFLTTLYDPLNAMDPNTYTDSSLFGNASPFPNIIINSVHLYHVIAFKLSSADYFHHLLFIPTLGLLGQYYRQGSFRGFLAFMISGLPGGIDYLNLTLVKHGLLDILVQKRCCAGLNVWLRGPSLVISAFILWLGFRYGSPTVPAAAAVAVGFLAAFNGQYYTKQSVSNYAITHCLGTVKERISLTTGTAVPDWKRIAMSPRVKAPQNTMS